MSVPFVTHPSFQCDGVDYGYFTRQGGVSDNAFASLNCGMGSGDLLDNVYENHRRVAASFHLGVQQLLFCKQIHSNKVITVTEAWARHLRPEADAMVTKQSGIALAVMSADCAPVLFFDAQQHIIGAAHAGWKGAIGGIVDETITAMEALGGAAKTIHACIGPCIQHESYEVTGEFYNTFIGHAKSNAAFFKQGKDNEHFQFDLPSYIAKRLELRGVQHISKLNHDTLSDEQNFFSYRRRTLRDELQNGIQMSAIALRKS